MHLKAQLDTLFVQKYIGLEHAYVDAYNAIAQDQNGYLYLGGIWGPGMVRFDGYEFKHYLPDSKLEKSISNMSIRYIYADSKSNVWVSTYQGLNRFDTKKETFEVMLSDENNANTIASNVAEPILEYQDHLWVGSVNGLSKYDYETEKFERFIVDSTKEQGPNFIIQMIPHLTNPDFMWIGTNEGLYSFSISREVFSKIDAIPYSIFGLYQHTDGKVYISPGGFAELVIFDPISGEIVRIALKRPNEMHFQPSISHTYCSIPIDKKHFLVSASTGLARVNIFDKSVYFLPTSNEVNDLPYHERIRNFLKDPSGYLWLPSYTGLAKSRDKLFPTIQNGFAKKVLVNTIEIKNDYKLDRGMGYLDQLEFESHEKDLKFVFSLPNPEDVKTLKYAYRINGSDWKEQNENYIQFNNQSGGKFNLELKAAEKGEDWSPISTYNFTIQKDFWETLIFKTLAGLTMLGLFLSFYFLRMKHIRKEERLKASFQKQLAEVEMSALRAQMNPHFLFNTMNSINHYILKNEPDEASDYLTKFSRLVRQILNNSKSKTVTLNDELSALQLYVEMEQLRFENKFEFEIFVEEDVNRDLIKIPPLLIQPYIENAIWHGLMHKEESGKIDLSIGRENGVLNISIKDNGIGREKAKEYVSNYDKSKKSYGMQITKDRVNLVNQIYNINTDIEINDLYVSNEAVGTEVILSIPIIA